MSARRPNPGNNARPGGGKGTGGRGQSASGKGQGQGAQRVALASGLTGGGLTAVFAIIAWVVCLILRTVDGLGVFWSNVASLAWSVLVLGAVAAIVNYIVGFMRGRIYFPGAGVNAMGKTAAGSRVAWAWTSALFLALTAPVVVYVLAAFWLNSAMTIAFCLLLVCAPAGIVFALLAPLTVRE